MSIYIYIYISLDLSKSGYKKYIIQHKVAGWKPGMVESNQPPCEQCFNQ